MLRLVQLIMRYFNEHRQKLIKQKYIRGAKSTQESSEPRVELPSATRLPLYELEITGSTVQEGVPSIDAPVPIQNAGDNGIDITVRGINLFNGMEYQTKTITGITVTCENNIFTIKGTATKGYVIVPLLMPVSLVSGGEYTGRISKIWGNAFPKSVSFNIYNKRYSKVAVLCQSSSISDNDIKGKYSFTEEEINGGLLGGINIVIDEGQSVDCSVRLDIIKGDYTEQAMPDFEPYIEPVTVSVPNRLSGVGHMNFACIEIDGLDDNEYPHKDKLSLKDGRVIYHNSISQYEITGNEEYLENDYVYDFLFDGTYNSFAYYADTYPQCTVIGDGVTDGSMCALLGEGNGPFTIHGIIYIPDLTPSEIRAKLKKLYTSGNPAIIQYVSGWGAVDITDTELGQALLGIRLPENATAVIEVTSSIPVSKIKASYYSKEKEDKYFLTVHYRDTNGSTLLESKVSSVRRDSRYIVIPPEIEGYEMLQDKIEGYLTEDKEIIITYKET